MPEDCSQLSRRCGLGLGLLAGKANSGAHEERSVPESGSLTDQEARNSVLGPCPGLMDCVLATLHSEKDLRLQLHSAVLVLLVGIQRPLLLHYQSSLVVILT